MNAKHLEKEAIIVAQAVRFGAITIATNMAGRGTDIKLCPGVVELGGLAVIGTERHESRRIDNQLRGRSGRQGDPGYTRFYLSEEDEIMKRFGSERFKSMLSMVVMQKGSGVETPLESKMFSNFVESAQKKIEGNNFDSRKTVLEYDEVLRKQREIIYLQRNDILFLDDMEPTVLKMMDSVIERNVERYVTSAGKKATLDLKNFMTNVAWRFFNHNEWSESDFENKTLPEVKEMLIDKLKANLEDKKNTIPLQ